MSFHALPSWWRRTSSLPIGCLDAVLRLYSLLAFFYVVDLSGQSQNLPPWAWSHDFPKLLVLLALLAFQLSLLVKPGALFLWRALFGRLGCNSISAATAAVASPLIFYFPLFPATSALIDADFTCRGVKSLPTSQCVRLSVCLPVLYLSPVVVPLVLDTHSTSYQTKPSFLLQTVRHAAAAAT